MINAAMSFAERLLQAAMSAQVRVTEDLMTVRAVVYRRLYGAGWKPSLQPSRGGKLSHRSDETLLADFLAGEATAFDDLCGRHLAKLVGHARRHAPRPADADDLVQETLLVLLRRGPEILQHETPNVAGFLFATLRNKLLKAHAARTFAELEDTPGDVDLSELASAQSERMAVVRLIERVCNILEEQVLVMTLDGYKNTEIAATLGIPAGHVAKLKFDAKKKLHAAWEFAA